MKTRQLLSLIVAIAMLFVFGSVVLAQEVMPDVQVADTGIVDGAVTIVEATVNGPGWAVIHADDDGKPGPVIGYAPLVEGVNTDVTVDIDEDATTPILHAMLHVDEGVVGAYEFPGPDGPVKVGDAIVMAKFSAAPLVEPAAMPGTGAATSTPLILAAATALLAGFGANVVVSRRSRA